VGQCEAITSSVAFGDTSSIKEEEAAKRSELVRMTGATVAFIVQTNAHRFSPGFIPGPAGAEFGQAPNRRQTPE